MKQEYPKVLNRAQRRYLLCALFLTGAASLILEIVGARVISPYYGSSLFCWSALITVTLLSLAAGYALGGRRADSHASLAELSRLICCAGGACAAIPFLRVPVLKTAAVLGVQLGALSSATVLIAPALICLSALGPLAIRLSAPALASVGQSAGDVYAVSTIGGVLGAALAGFVLVPLCAVSHIVYGLAVSLLLLGALGLYLSAQPVTLKPLAAAAAAALIGFWPRTRPASNLLLSAESRYGQIKVLDFQGKRYLLVDGTSQSIAALPKDGGAYESAASYLRCLELAALLRPGARRGLAIGAGAGLLPSALERHYGLVMDSVELDPAVLAAARSHFGFAPRGDVFAQDGRVMLEGTARRYDVMILDAFGAELPPYHLFTAEAFSAMRKTLAPGGVLAVNFPSLVSGDDRPWLSVYKTLRSVFPEVRAYAGSAPQRGLANVLFFCADAAWKKPDVKRAARPPIRADLEFLLANELSPAEADLAGAILLNDDYAPLEALLARTSLVFRGLIQENLASVILH